MPADALRRESNSSAMCTTTSHRFASAAKTNALANAVSTTFDSSYASDDSVTSPRSIAHLDARSGTLAETARMPIEPFRCSIVSAVRLWSFSIPGASTLNHGIY